MEEALIEVSTLWRFAGNDLICDVIFDEMAILGFCHLLVK
jgi:hypothetical protein